MKIKILLSLLVVVSALMFLSACAPSSTPAASDSTSLDGKALVESRCIACHGLDRVTSKTKTETEWTSTVERMIGNGAVLNDAEKAAAIAYLAATYK